jgi:hypothetical protein
MVKRCGLVRYLVGLRSYLSVSRNHAGLCNHDLAKLLQRLPLLAHADSWDRSPLQWLQTERRLALILCAYERTDSCSVVGGCSSSLGSLGRHGVFSVLCLFKHLNDLCALNASIAPCFNLRLTSV